MLEKDMERRDKEDLSEIKIEFVTVVVTESWTIDA